MTEPTQPTPHCISCGGTNTRYVAKRNKWSCQDPVCAELFSAPSQANGEASEFVKQNIFLSYAHKKDGIDDCTADLVEALRARLDARHHTWIDKQQLSPSQDWRRGITDGIMESDRVLSFLSQRSIHKPGVCLEEIGIAMSHKYGAIATLLADGSVMNSVPASVNHIQYLDLSDWQEAKAQGEKNWENWLDQKTNIILKIIANNAGFAGEIEELSKTLSPLPQTAKVGRFIEQGLIGRQWVKDAIDDWRLQQLDQRMFWLLAGPGMGKSAIAAHLIHHSKLHAIAYHFCDYNIPESRSAVGFVLNLAFMLAARLPDYRRFLQTQIKMLTKPVGQYNADELLGRLVIEPLRSRIDGGQREDRLLVVIDALDEALPELPQLIAKHLDDMPVWLGFVVTSRPDVKGVLEKFPAFELKIDDERNQKDLLAYVQDWRQKSPDVPLGVTLQNQLIEASEGSILYMVMLRDGYEKKLFDLSNPSQLPKGIGGVYRMWMQRQFGIAPQENSDWCTLCYPLLQMLCASPFPLPLATAAKVLGWKGQDRIHALAPLGSLVTLQAEHLQLCHRSFGEWLCDESSTHNPYWINKSEGQMQLAIGLYKQLENYSNGSESGNIYLALPLLLEGLDEDQCNELLQPDWAAGMQRMSELDDFLGVFHHKIIYRSKIALQHWIVKQYKKHLSTEHPDTLKSMNNLASTFFQVGEYENAREVNEDVLNYRLQILGSDHPDSLMSMNNLAATLLKIGEYADALKLFAKVLDCQIRVLGEDHSDTFTCMNNLALTLSEIGAHEEARKMLAKVLDYEIRVLGEDHPDTLIIMNNLALTLSNLGLYEDACKLNEKVLNFKLQILGEDHPDTLMSMSNLAATFSELNAHEDACKMHEKVLNYMLQIMGEDHPDTMTSMNNLASSLFEIGDHEEARKLHEKVVEYMLQKFGKDHPDTHMYINNLAKTHSEMGAHEDACILRQMVLESHKYKLGEEHPYTLASMNNVASTLSAMGAHEDARILLEKVLVINSKKPDINYLDLLSTLQNMAVIMLNLGDYVKACNFQNQALDLCYKFSPNDNKLKIRIIENFLEIKMRQGDKKALKTMQKQIKQLSQHTKKSSPGYFH